MRKILLLIFISINIICYSQKQFNDSSIVVGYIKNGYEGSHLGEKTIDFCHLSYDKKVENGTVLIVTGIYHCDDYSSLKRQEDFFYVYYKGKEYLIERSSLHFIDSIDYYTKIQSLSGSEYKTFKEHSSLIASMYHDKKVNDIYSKLNSFATKGLGILSWNIFDVSEYTDGTGAKFEVYNPTKKIIKYISFTLVGKNPVGDIIYKLGKPTVTVRCIGPIKPYCTGSYSFDYIWFSDLVETAKISLITVQYMDGTIKKITIPKNIELKNEEYEYLNLDSDS